MVIILFAISNAMWLIGRNQLEWDGYKDDDFEDGKFQKPLYHTIFGSLQYMIYIVLGEL